MELIELNNETIESMIYEIRGVKVMLDFDLARIYGYTTKAFNQQVKNNIEKFPTRYRFQLSKNELDNFARSKNLTAQIWATNEGGRTSLPYAFTKQGIYMLMTVLKGELATKQSIVLIDTFKQMKDCLSNSINNGYIDYEFKSFDNRLTNVEKDLEMIMDSFNNDINENHFLIMDGKRIEADLAYQKIYKKANHSIYIIDDYIDLKTLQLLKVCDSKIEIIIISDNKAKNNLNRNFINDFTKDTKIEMAFKKNNNRFHDRYIIIDFNYLNESIYHCGSSSKDCGNKISTIIKIEENGVYKPLIEEILNNKNIDFNS